MEGDKSIIFGKPVDLQREWETIAAHLGSMCEGNKYIEYNKEIARLKSKLLHLQEEVDGYRAHNKNLSSMNDDLVERVKTLISMQDNQLEQYSTALMLMTEERRELWHSLGASQKRIKQLERLAHQGSCRCQDVEAKESGDDIESVGSSQDYLANTENTEDVTSRIRQTNEDEIVDVRDLRKMAESGVRHLDSMESSIDSSHVAPKSAPTPLRSKGYFVNSMIEKLEKKQKLKSFDDPKPKKIDDVASNASSDAEVESSNSNASSKPVVGSSESQALYDAEIGEWKSRVFELEQEVHDLRSTCQSLTGMLERTYDEIQMSSSLQEHDDTKDRLIACLRSRLLEAICDLMKVEKRRLDVKSVACGSSLPRPEKVAEAQDSLVKTSQSDPILSPSRSLASRLLASPAMKLKAIREDNYGKLRRLSCWKPNAPDDSA